MPRGHRAELSLNELTAARVAYANGATFLALAAEHGLAERTLRRLLKTVGVEPRPKGPAPRQLPVALILANHDAGGWHQNPGETRPVRYGR
jgi:hypothetical protein